MDLRLSGTTTSSDIEGTNTSSLGDVDLGSASVVDGASTHTSEKLADGAITKTDSSQDLNSIIDPNEDQQTILLISQPNVSDRPFTLMGITSVFVVWHDSLEAQTS